MIVLKPVRINSVYFIVLLLVPLIIADNNCRIDKVEIPVYPSRIILTFECYSGMNFNPDIPIDNGSGQSEYNELDLSPNLYVEIPISQVCKFVNIFILDLSYNKIKNITNVFADLRCLKLLRNFDMSSNLIETPLKASDFDSDFTSHLEYLNLKFNRIPSIETRVFFKDDGTSAFPKLSYLDLSYNELKVLDLVWPMSLLHPALKVMLAYNKITTFKNQLDMPYNDRHLTAISGNRSVDVKHNLISRFDDSNLLQYSLKSAYDLEKFLEKLDNFDFRTNRIYCVCPETSGLYSVNWFSQFSKFVRHSDSLIYQLVCTNSPSHSVFNFTCPFFTTFKTKVSTSMMPIEQSSTTTTSKTTTTIRLLTTPTTSTLPTSTTSTLTTPTTSTLPITTTTSPTTSIKTVANSSTKNLSTTHKVSLEKIHSTASEILKSLADEISLEIKNNTTADTNIRYSLIFFWFLLPVFPIVILILFLCCNFRAILITMQQKFGINFCGWLRSDELEVSESDNNKYHDATICYSLYDQGWFEESFLPTFSDYIRGYKINILGLNYPQSNSVPVNISHVECMKSSKRILLLLSEKFMANVWSNQRFPDLMRSLCHSDESCVVILVNICSVDNPNRPYIKNQMKLIQELIEIEKRTNICAKLKHRLTESFTLNQVECLEWDYSKFWSELLYLMPLHKTNLQSSSSLSQYSKRQTESPLSIIVNSTKPKLTEHDFQLSNNKRSTPITSHNLPKLLDLDKSSGPDTPKGFMEKKEFWTRFKSDKTLEPNGQKMEPPEKSESRIRGLLENILNIKNRSSSESETDSSDDDADTDTKRKAKRFKEPIDISITNEDLFTVENESSSRPISNKKRRMLMRKKRMEALKETYNVKGMFRF